MPDWDSEDLLRLSPRFLRHTPDPPSSPSDAFASLETLNFEPLPPPRPLHGTGSTDASAGLSDDFGEDTYEGTSTSAGSANDSGGSAGIQGSWFATLPPREPRTPQHQIVDPTREEPPDTETKFSSPWVSNSVETTPQVIRRKARAKAQEARVRTMAAQTAERDRDREAELRAGLRAVLEARAEAEAEAQRASAAAMEVCFDRILASLAQEGYTWGDLVEWVSRPSSGRRADRWAGLFRNRTQLSRILNLWAWKGTQDMRRQVQEWAVGYMGRIVSAEAEQVTKQGVLQSRRLNIDDSFLRSFDLSGVHDRIRTLCPCMSTLLRSFSTTRRQAREDARELSTQKERDLRDKQRERKDTVCYSPSHDLSHPPNTSIQRIGTCMADLLGERSQNNSLTKHVITLYLYATGAKRQLISVLHKWGICSSYPTIAGSITSGDIPEAQKPNKPTRTIETDEDDEDEDPDWLPDSDDSDSASEDNSEVAEEDDLPGDEIFESLDDAVEQAAGTSPDDAQEGRASAGARQDAIENAIGHDAPASSSEAPTPFLALLRRGAGLLRRICESCRATARRRAHECLCGHVYDNINMMFRIAEQILGRKDSQENGTCATIFPLFDAPPDQMRTSELLESLDKAPPLDMDDILHTPEEATLFQHSLAHTLLRELVKDERFARFREDVDECLPDKLDHIPLHQTEIHPLPAMQIDESSITGNAEVMDAMFAELGFDTADPNFYATVRPIFGDQLSIARLRTLISNRAGHESLGNSYTYAVFGPGLFHHQMALVHGIIETHFGDSTSGTVNPACLMFFNTLIDRKPLVLTSLPPYRVCCDLILVVLTACAPVLLQEVSGAQDIEKYAATVTFAQLRQDVSKVFDLICNPRVVSVLRRARADELLQRQENAPEDPEFDLLAEKLKTGDMVFENMALLVRDALVLREFQDAIKGGYSGRIYRVLKVLALMYRGSGRVKYAHELLHLIHNLTHVWPKGLRYVLARHPCVKRY